MIVAGAAGVVASVAFGGINPANAATPFLQGISAMVNMPLPLVYAGAAAMVARTGSVEYLTHVARRVLRKRISLLAAVFVVIYAAISYTGIGALAATLILAPLSRSTFGNAPGLIAGMGIAGCAAMAASPVTAIGLVSSKLAGLDPMAYGNAMRPYALLFLAGGAGIAAIGARLDSPARHQPESPPDPKGESCSSNGTDPTFTTSTLITRATPTDLLKALPAVLLILLVALGPALAGAAPSSPLAAALVNPLVVMFAVGGASKLCLGTSLNQVASHFAEGTADILVILFSAGVFIGFMNVISPLGPFETISGLVLKVPFVSRVLLPVACTATFLLGALIGASISGALPLILPVWLSGGIPPETAGLMAISLALGAQLSPVQINVLAFSRTYDMPAPFIIRITSPYIVVAGVCLVALSALR